MWFWFFFGTTSKLVKMKLAIFVTLALAGFAAGDNILPSFTWIPDSGSEAGVPHLAIHFHDGKPDDIALLKRINPIARQNGESEENIDQCIFRGNLLLDSDVSVVLTGGCPFEDTFEIQMHSERIPDYMFKSVNGKVSALPSVYKTKGLAHDIALKPPAAAHISNKENPTPPPNALNLNVRISWDNSFANRFGGDALNSMRRVAAHASDMYQWPTIATKLNWNIQNGANVGITLQADENNLNTAGRYNSASVNSNVYMCSQNDASGVVGIAWVGTICSSTSYRTAVVEYFHSDSQSGEIMAHEVGHNTGMNHDFSGSPGSPRYDSSGRTCTNIGGVMDYYQTVTRWSSCSNEDFQSTSHGCLG